MSSFERQQLLQWIIETIESNKQPDYFLLPREIIFELEKRDDFDINTHPITIGATGSIGFLRTIPIKLGYKIIPCYFKDDQMIEYVIPLNTYIKAKDWFKALLLHLADGNSFDSFINQYDIRGYEKDVKDQFDEIKRQAQISSEYVIVGTSRLQFGYKILRNKIFELTDEYPMKSDYLLSEHRDVTEELSAWEEQYHKKHPDKPPLTFHEHDLWRRGWICGNSKK